MKFRLYWASKADDLPEDETVEINTLEDLKKLDKDTGNHSLVVDFDDEPSITIYNNYLE